MSAKIKILVISLHIESDTNYSYGPTDAPAVLLKVKAIGHLGAEENIAHTKAITQFIGEATGLKPNRVLVLYQDLDPTEVGIHATTVAELNKKAAQK